MRWQHGDVLFISEDKIPEEEKEFKNAEGFIVEKGEGVHTHTLEKIDGVKGYVDSKKTLWFTGGVKVGHEEHKIMEIPAPIVRKEIEWEYDAEAEEGRNVID